tara:strand:- start:8412 stop:8795 length:384 start_codon:yes stop_codon:yes gene_type:complete
MKKSINIILKGVVSITIVNVWLFRFNKKTIYRGGGADNMISEFIAYGLSENTLYIVGALKVLAALMLFFGIFFKKLVFPSLLIISVLMIGALYFHFSIGDQLIKSLPAFLMLFSCIIIFFLERKSKS